MSPRYDPILEQDVLTEEEKFLREQFRDVREEVQFLRATLIDMKTDQVEWSRQTNQNLVSIGRMVNASLTVMFLTVFFIALLLLTITNKVAPDWWHTPWWPL